MNVIHDSYVLYVSYRTKAQKSIEMNIKMLYNCIRQVVKRIKLYENDYNR